MKQKPKTRQASHDVHDGPARRVCVGCHRIPKFCTCGTNVVATCPICNKPAEVGQHFPAIDCSGRLKGYVPPGSCT